MDEVAASTWRLALAGSSEAVLVTEFIEAAPESGPVLHANEACEQLLGLRPGARPGPADAWLRGPLTDRHAVARLSKALGQRAPVHEDLLITRPDGSSGWVAVDARVLDDPAAGPACVLWRLRDISAEKNAYLRLAEAESKLRAVCAAVGASTFVGRATPDFTLTALGPGAAAQLGLAGPALQVLPLPLSEVLAQDEAQALIEQSVRARAAGQRLVWISALRARRGWVEWQATLTAGSGADAEWQGVIVDVTRREEDRKALRDCQALLRRNEMRGEQQRNQERRSVAQELHDDLGQLLNAARLELGRLHQQHAQGALRPDTLDRLDEFLSLSTKCSRRLVDRLRPPILDLGLVAALESLRDELRFRTSLGCELRAPPEVTLPDFITHGVYRLVREALRFHESLRPAGALEIQLRMAQDGLELDVRAGALAPDAPPAPAPANLRQMSELALVLGGKLEMVHSDGCAPLIKFRLPAAVIACVVEESA